MNTTFINNYLDGTTVFKDPKGTQYAFTYATTVGALPTTVGVENHYTYIHVYSNAKCNGENTESVAPARNIAISIILEGGGVYCVDS